MKMMKTMTARVNLSDTKQNQIVGSRTELRQAGVEYLQRGQWREAAECLSRLADQLPDDEEIASLLEEATFKMSLEEQQSTQRWRQVAQRVGRLALVGAIIIFAAFSLALVLGASLQYHAEQAEAHTQYQTQTQKALSLKEAEQYLRAGQYAEAEQLYERLLRQYPDNKEVQMGLEKAKQQAQLASLYSQALATESQGQLAEALDQWRTLQELKPGYKDVAERVAKLEGGIALTSLFQRAEQSYQEQQWQQAIELYQELKGEAPQFEVEKVSAHLFECYLNRGAELLVGEKGTLRSADVSEAHDLFTQALVLHPREPRVVLGRELVQLLEESRAKCGEDQSCFLAVLEDHLYRRRPGNGEEMPATLMARMHLSLAESLETDGNFQAALEHYKRMVDLDVGGSERALAEEGLSRLMVGSTPTPIATPIPTEMTETPTETPSATLTALPQARVNAELLNLRAGPGTEYRIRASLPKGFPVAATGIDESGSWVKVLTALPDPAREGWLHMSYLTFPGGPPKLPVVIAE